VLIEHTLAHVAGGPLRDLEDVFSADRSARAKAEDWLGANAAVQPLRVSA